MLNTQATIPGAPSFEEFERQTAGIFQQYSEDITSGNLSDSDDYLYLETLSSHGGGLDKFIADIEYLQYRARGCAQIGIKFKGATTGKDYRKFLNCMRAWCRKCGAVGGPIHKKRMAHIIEKVGLGVEMGIVYNLTFTVNEADRYLFQSRAGENSLIRMAQKITKEEQPGRGSMAALHLFGNKYPGKFHPHVETLTFDSPGAKFVLSKKTLERINKRWQKALRGFGCRSVRPGSVHYSFATTPEKIRHKLKYVTRPCPGPENYEAIKGDVALSRFVWVEMNGFMYIRYFNGYRNKKNKNEQVKEVVKECCSAAGEKLIYVPNDVMTRSEFNLRYMPWEYEKLGDGLYRINGP